MGLCDPAVAPPGEGGIRGYRFEVGAELVSGKCEKRARDLRLVIFEVGATPPRARVDGDGWRLRDTLAAVVPDPVQRLALDLHPARLGHAGGSVEQSHQRQARVVRDLSEPSARAIRERVAARLNHA